VARLREEVEEVGIRVREAFRIEGAFKHLNLVAAVAIECSGKAQCLELRFVEIIFDAWKSESPKSIRRKPHSAASRARAMHRLKTSHSSS
jgi:hypothetical protein